MSHSTISYESLSESMGSSVASAMVPDHAPDVDSESEPIEAPASPMVSNSNFVEPSLNSKPFSGCDTLVGSASSDPDDEPLGSPDTTDYFGGSEFSEDDPSEDYSIDAPSGTDESLLAQAAPVIALESPPVLSPPIAPYRPRKIVQGPRKTVQPQPPLPPSILARINDWIAAYLSSPPPSPARSGPSRMRPQSSPSSSSGPPPKRCRVSLAPASPAPTLHYVPTELLPPRKRFIALERIETLKREVVSLTTRLAAAVIQIDALKRDDIGRDVREVGIEARLKRVKDTMQRR
ncbi:hypothetical protein Tco_1376420 [Tanacetum coccineum]